MRHPIFNSIYDMEQSINAIQCQGCTYIWDFDQRYSFSFHCLDLGSADYTLLNMTACTFLLNIYIFPNCTYTVKVTSCNEAPYFDNVSFRCLNLGSDDYTLSMPNSAFQMGETRACTDIAIPEDTIVEVTETFTVTLTGTADVVVNSTARTATVSIEDNNGKFEHTSYNS